MRNPISRSWRLKHWMCPSCHAHFSTSTNLFASVFPTRPKSQKRLPSGPARTRFAPSPTGNLHLGSIRTALFNYLLAKRTGGQFLLRIEDTDQKRTIEGAEKRLQSDLLWLGLQWDEGPNVGGPHGPYHQSSRRALYRSHIDSLLESGHAYRCFCSSHRLDNLNRSRNDLGLPLGYDRACADISSSESDRRAKSGEAYVVRFLDPRSGYPTYQDLVYGKVSRPTLKYSDVFNDPILVKSDGFPTYHFANVVDDHEMKISHVVRGAEWMSSTPLHVALYDAFGWEPPIFAHVGLLTDEYGQKLSKRNADIDIEWFEKQDVFPETMVNFAALLGWSHSGKSDVMTLEELVHTFDLKFTKGNQIVSFEKLWFLQKAHARRHIANRTPTFSSMVDKVAAEVEARNTPAQVSSVLLGHSRRSLHDYITSLFLAEGENVQYTTASAFVTSHAGFFAPLPPLPHYAPPSPQIPHAALRAFASALCLTPAERWTADTHRHNISSRIDVVQSPPPPPLADDNDDDDDSSARAALNSTSSTSNTSNSNSNNNLNLAEPISQRQWSEGFHHYLRWALLAGASGPNSASTMEVLGRDVCITRILEANKILAAQDSVEKSEQWW